jgi:hypothetical protein
MTVLKATLQLFLELAGAATKSSVSARPSADVERFLSLKPLRSCYVT